MKKLFTLLALIFCLSGKAQTYVAIPDSNFIHYLKTIVPTAFKGDSLNTSSTLVTTSTTTLSLYGSSISNLNGVQYFTSLTYLDCGFNTLTNLPTLPNSLTYLDCNNNSITSLPALPSSLTYLACYTNSLTTLPSLPNSLNTLDCDNNSLTTLPSLPNSLNTLYCYNNSLTILPVLPNSLTYLGCDNNSLTNLPALPNLLKTLYCYSNSLTSLPALPDSLTTLGCDHNNITCFPTFPNSITTFYIDPNPYNCFPNYITAMSAADLATPLCAAGNSNGCAIVAGVENFNIQNSTFQIYPNPNNGNFVIETTATTKQMLQVYDVNAKLILSQTINGKTNIDAGNLAAGVYNLSLINSSEVVNKRLVIVK
ncbi:MAG TPA: T9SS type A sorting domain-containing protein [Bacteroidia bacterium]|nr:T9SS type A sorting domain-containing protein [Bacteroidia bacterium]